MIRSIILDDEWIIRMGLQKIIRENVREMVVEATFGTSQECLAFLDTNMIDLIITDIRMPGLNGIELLKLIRERGLKIDVIIISGYSDFEYCREAVRFQAYDYILKPINKDEFISLLKRYIAKKIPSDFQEFTKHPVSITDKGGSLIDEVKKYIRINIQNHTSRDTLADKFKLNPSYLSQLFKKETGMTLSEFSTNVRLELACSYLQDPSLRVAEISDMVGFTSPRQFNISFKKKYGVTPTNYRQDSDGKIQY